MPNLTYRDLQRMLDFLQELHTLCNLEMFPDLVLSALPKVVSSDFTGFCPTNFNQHRTSLDSFPQRFGSLERQEAEQVVLQNFYEHPFVNYYLRTNDGTAHTISDFLGESQLHRLEGLYQGLLRPLGMKEQMNMVLRVPHAKEKPSLTNSVEDIVVTLHRPQRNFSERERLMLNLLRPHLILAYQNAKALTQIQHELDRSNQMIEQLGTITLTVDGQVMLVASQARKLLAQYFPLSSHQGNHLPENLQRWVHYQISQRAQSDNICQPYLPLRVEQEDRRLVVRLIGDRLQDQYLLLLEEQPLSSFSPESLELLGLTRREAEVLFWGAKDKSTKEIALILNCSNKTVEKHFEHVYEKLGVRTRTAAVIKALENLGIVN